jgi:hypothetical protein
LKKEKLDSFYLPIYHPSVGEVVAEVEESWLFNMNRIEKFEVNWDPYDESQVSVVHAQQYPEQCECRYGHKSSNGTAGCKPFWRNHT